MKTFTKNQICREEPGFCARVVRAVEALKERLVEKYQSRLPREEVRRAIGEAEALAWSTPFPHLLLPDFAEVAIARITNRSTGRLLRRAGIISAVGAAAIAVSGCGKGPAAMQAPPPPAVTVAPVEQKDVTDWNEFTGRTDAVSSVEIRPRVSGYIQEVKFQSGQLVKRGDILFVIDPRWIKADFDHSQAQYQQATATMVNAQREADRMTQLLTKKAVSTEEADTRQTQYQESKAALLAAQATRDSAQLDLQSTEIRSPIDGRVSRALLTEGNYICGIPGQTTLLTSVVSVDPMYVYADMDENSLLKFNKMAAERKATDGPAAKIPVELQLADETGYPHKGYIESFNNRVDPNTGTIVLRAVFPNADARLVPGLFAHIRVPLSDPHQALLVEEAAIGTDQGQKFVLTLGPDNKVEYRQVQLGPLIDGKRVVLDGLKPGEKVIVNGLQHARPGMPVTPQEQTAESQPKNPNTAER